MPLTKVTDGTTAALALGVETELVDTGNVLGCYQLEVNLANLANGEEVEIVVYNKVLSTDGYEVAWRDTFGHVSDPKVIQSLPVSALYGCRATIRQSGGAGRTFKWNLCRLDT